MTAPQRLEDRSQSLPQHWEQRRLLGDLSGAMPTLPAYSPQPGPMPAPPNAPLPFRSFQAWWG